MEQSATTDAVFEPVSPQSTFEETVDRLGTAIRLGLLAPGSQLPAERDLAYQLRISRSTLRQALTTLVKSGHLVAYRGRSGGTFVAADPAPVAEGGGEPLGEEAWAVLDARVAAETGGCILACERAWLADLEHLASLVDRMAAAPDVAEYRRADSCFHIAVAEAAHSPRLVTAMTELQGQMSDLLARIPHPEHVLARSNSQHRRLVALIGRRDAPRAVQLMRGHIQGTEHILAGLLPPVGPLAPTAYRAEPEPVIYSS